MRKNNKYSRDVHVETSFLLNMTRNRDCHVRTTSFLAMTMVGLFSFNVQAECTPAPDCASIGYTETSCEGDFIKCPFDTSKLHCTPCDSKYQYSCDGKYATASIGNTCNGKYAGCECVDGAKLGSSTCECDTACIVGAIYYSDGTCSSCVEDAKTPVGVVVKKNKLIISRAKGSTMAWASSYIDTSLTNYTDAHYDINGKSNTATIVSAYPSGASNNNAAIYCNSYSTEGTNAGDWYLPAGGEASIYIYDNYSTIKATMTRLGWGAFAYYLWTSSEGSNDTAFGIHTDGGAMYKANKTYATYVACFRHI